MRWSRKDRRFAVNSLLLAILLYPLSLLADSPATVVVNYRDGQYVVDMDARFRASETQVRALFTDYNHLDRINPAIRHSAILSSEPGVVRVRTEIDACLWFFCRQIIRVQDVFEAEDGSITAVTVAGLSDFRSGYQRFHFWQEAEMTRVLLHTEAVPDFWVPPLVGPWLIRRELRDELQDTVKRVEQLTATPGH